MFDSFPVSNETFPAGGSVAESMWWVGCGVYVVGGWVWKMKLMLTQLSTKLELKLKLKLSLAILKHCFLRKN